MKHRTEIGVSNYNPYIFGLPGGDKKQYPHLQACHLMRKFSECCGAEHPERLRGTHLRKHIATTCVMLNLEPQDISDLSNFMGHSENIHKGIYRQPIVSREILGISKLLEAAQGTQGIEAADDSDDNNSSDEEEFREEYEYEKPAKCSSSTTPRGPSDYLTSTKKKITTERYGFTKKVRWTEEEKEAIFRIFSENSQKEVLPSLKTIQLVIKETPALQKRTSPQPTWIHNQLKKKNKKKLSFSS
ncbi:uncharacterized protein [Leptinotarsa decemlineata]|uniref:uncharacterized protein n=1 Tax=Leptinotarsa decemlineata TaxID=7539 RepID=UPI003D308E17